MKYLPTNHQALPFLCEWIVRKYFAGQSFKDAVKDIRYYRSMESE